MTNKKIKKETNLSRISKFTATVVISVLIIFTVVKAGTITPPSGAGEPSAKFYTLSEIYEFIVNNTAATEGAHDFTFSDALAGTGRTLTEIYNVLASLISADQVKLGTTYLNVAGTLVPSGGDATTIDVCSTKTYFGDSQTDWNLATGALTIDAAKVLSGETYCSTAGTMTNVGAQTITPGTSTTTITQGYHDGAGYCEGDADLISTNIKSGANIFNVAGDSNVVDTSSGDAGAGDIVSNKIAWVDGAEITGSFASSTATATTEGEEITPSAGTWLSKVTVAITNLIASVIKSGETVGGIAGELLPSGGTASPSNVAAGTTFFGALQSDWTPQTGSFDPYTPQWLQTKDDWVNSGGTTGEYILEEATWSAVSGSPFDGYADINYLGATDLYSGAVKRDERTGLWWSDIMAVGTTASTTSNNFDPATDGVRPTGGQAIGFCDALNTANFGGYNNWYLPTQKELMQAYIDGSANNLSRPGYYFWSSTETSWGSTYAWRVYLYHGYTYSILRLPRIMFVVFAGNFIIFIILIIL